MAWMVYVTSTIDLALALLVYYSLPMRMVCGGVPPPLERTEPRCSAHRLEQIRLRYADGEGWDG